MNNMGINNGMNNMGMNNMGMNNTNCPEYVTWLILGIVQIVSICCCNCIGFVFGLITVIFITGANNRFKLGDMQGYQSKAKTAKIVNIIGWALMLGGTIISLITGAFETLISYAQSLM